mgnify:CR=1 FL=1
MVKEPITCELKACIKSLCDEYRKYNSIDPACFDRYRVKRGLRNPDGTGVIAGVTQICNVHGYVLNEGERMPVDGQLTYRGINIRDIIENCCKEQRYGYEETAWLLIFGQLPTQAQLDSFNEIIASYRELPDNFSEDMIIKAPSADIMNKLARSVLALYSYDYNPDDTSLENVLRQSIELIARTPTIITAAYQVKRRAYDHKSMYFHTPKPEYSTAQNILRTLRSDKSFTEEEAKLLDLCHPRTYLVGHRYLFGYCRGHRLAERAQARRRQHQGDGDAGMHQRGRFKLEGRRRDHRLFNEADE